MNFVHASTDLADGYLSLCLKCLSDFLSRTIPWVFSLFYEEYPDDPFGVDTVVGALGDRQSKGQWECGAVVRYGVWLVIFCGEGIWGMQLVQNSSSWFITKYWQDYLSRTWIFWSLEVRRVTYLEKSRKQRSLKLLGLQKIDCNGWVSISKNSMQLMSQISVTSIIL